MMNQGVFVTEQPGRLEGEEDIRCLEDESNTRLFGGYGDNRRF